MYQEYQKEMVAQSLRREQVKTAERARIVAKRESDSALKEAKAKTSFADKNREIEYQIADLQNERARLLLESQRSRARSAKHKNKLELAANTEIEI